MKVRTKLIIVIVFVALGPLAVSAWTTIDVHQSAFEQKVGELQLVSAAYGATIAQGQLAAAQRGLGGIAQRSTHWPSLVPAEREGGAWLVFSQLDEVASVMVIDGDDVLLEPTAFIATSVDDAEWAAHPHLESSDLDRIRSALPLDEAREHGSAIGPAVFVGANALLPIAFAVDGVSEDSNKWVVGVGLSVASICAQIVDNRPPNTRVAVWDDAGRTLCSSGSASQIPFEQIRDRGRESFRVAPNGAELLAAVAKTPTGWSVVIEQPAADALAAGRQMRMQTLYWLGLGILAAIITGTLLSRGITKPLRALETGAHRVAGGEYETQISIDSRDELGELARAFNAMSKEIQRWNMELTSRVDERTRELKAAQDQLLEVRKLAAMSSLSAGVAHELNNPLASVVAFTQILLSKARKADDPKQLKILESVEKEALRMRDVVARMQRLSERQSNEYVAVRVADIFAEVHQHLEHRIADNSIEVVIEADSSLPPIRGDASQLAKALEHICDNSIKAMMSGELRQLELRARDINGEVVLVEVKDTGAGMAPEHVERAFEPFYTTKDGDWRGVGLGLSLAHRIVDEHGGSIQLESVVGTGTTVSITIPAMTDGNAHLV